MFFSRLPSKWQPIGFCYLAIIKLLSSFTWRHFTCEKAAILLFQTSRVGGEPLTYVKTFSCTNTFTNLLATWVRTLYYDTLLVLQLPGHRLVLHDWDWKLEPWHLAPPPDGGGLVQLRMRDCDPPPQVWLQEPQTPQSDHPPLTKIKISFCYVAIVLEGQVL